jgi:hypothetical protein
MEYKFECPHCSQHFSATHDLIGSKHQCPSCGQQFVVPTDLHPPTASANDWSLSKESQNSTSTPAETPPSRLSRGKLFGLGVIALIAAFGMIAVTVTFGNPSDKAAEAFGKIIFDLLMFAGGLTWCIFGGSSKRTRFAFLGFSTIYAISILVFVCIFWTNKYRSNEMANSVTNNLTSMVQRATNGEVPQMSPTGDTDIDSTLGPLNNFFHDVFGSLNQMEVEIAALHQEDVFSASVLTTPSSIQDEINKRVASKSIIERYQEGIPAMIESARAEYSSLPESQEIRDGALKGFNNAVNGRVPQLQAMFTLRLQQEAAQENFLRFILASFADYKWTDKTISFRTHTNVTKYNDLVQAMVKTVEDAQAFEKAQKDSMEAAKEKVKELYQ